MSVFTVRSVLIGIVATLTMDVLTLGAIKLRLIAPLRLQLIGRWFCVDSAGAGLHSDIAHAPPISHEFAIAVPVHYAIGVTLALLYLLVSSTFGINPRRPVTELGFALCPSLLSWLLMFPAMVYGWFGVRGPARTRLFLSSLVTRFGHWLSRTEINALHHAGAKSKCRSLREVYGHEHVCGLCAHMVPERSY